MEGRERELFELLEPSVAGQGLDLVEVDLGGSRRGLRVRIVVHSPDGVSHGDCARITRTCGQVLDEALPGSYTLEVSSPGVGRVMKEEREFDVFRGLPVRIRLQDEGGERTGTAGGTRPGSGVVLQSEDGTEAVIPWSSVAKARLVDGKSGGFGGAGR